MTNENLSRGEAAARSALLTVHGYDVSLDLRTAPDPDAAGFASRSLITFSCNEPGAETFLDFIHGGIDSVVLNGSRLDPADVVDGARIRLPELQQENRLEVAGTALYSRSGEGLHRFVDPADGQTYLYTQYEPADARRVFANFEQPDLKAAFTFHVTAPSSWTVVSNGAEAARRQLPETPGFSRWDFAPTQRISTYITAVLAGPYHAAQDRWSRILEDGGVLEVPLAAYCRASLAAAFDPERIFAVTKRGLDFFHDLFQYPYPFGKYDQAFVPEYNLGAMENPGLVTFTENYVFRGRATAAQYEARATTLLHEMAHIWFGDLVTMSWWDDLWLKESFADFMGTLAVAETTEWSTAWVTFANRRKAWAYVQDQLPTTHPIVADVPDLEAAKQNFDGITYAKGAAVLKQLVAFVGFDAFTAAARRYFRDHAYGNTSLADLLSVLSEASGRDMGDWARLWLQSAGVPALDIEFTVDDAGRFRSAVLVQDARDPVTGEAQLRPHRLKVGLYDYDAGGRLVRTASVDVDAAGERTAIPALAGVPRPALLLVNDEDLTYAKIRFDEPSLQTLLAGLDRLDDPLARASCWTALWSATRDAILPADEYVDAVQHFGPREDGVGVLQVLLDNARYAIDHYCPRRRRDAAREALAAVVVRELKATGPCSDLQLVWARTAAALGRRTPALRELIAGLLSGRETIEGLALDAELRWKLWQALAATGAAGAEELEAELARDNTGAGRVGHRTAMTARPLPAVKADAWRSAVHGNELSNELLSATIEGFGASGPELADGYRDDYFASLRTVWETRSIELATRVVRGLFPLEQDLADGQTPEGHPVAAQAAAWLAGNTEAPAALRRIVIEQRDQLVRALAAQAKG